MRYGVYVPPDWDRQTPLPLVVLLHGAGDDETAADRKKVMSALDRAITSGDVPPFVMVTPDGDRGLWMNWHDGTHRYEDWVLEEAVGLVRDAYPIVEGPAGLHLMGVSMGGGGGLQMWLAAPARFASATIISAPILDEEDTRRFLGRFMSEQAMDSVFGPPGAGGGVDPYTALVAESSLEGSRLIFGAASRDLGLIRESNRAFHRHLESNEVPHRFVVFRGWHAWTSWAGMFVFSLCHQLSDTCAMEVPDGWSVQTVGTPFHVVDSPSAIKPRDSRRNVATISTAVRLP
jgi:enterochelin esterase-like enzyme